MMKPIISTLATMLLTLGLITGGAALTPVAATNYLHTLPTYENTEILNFADFASASPKVTVARGNTITFFYWKHKVRKASDGANDTLKCYTRALLGLGFAQKKNTFTLNGSSVQLYESALFIIVRIRI